MFYQSIIELTFCQALYSNVIYPFSMITEKEES
jgi:hypothetical protein